MARGVTHAELSIGDSVFIRDQNQTNRLGRKVAGIAKRLGRGGWTITLDDGRSFKRSELEKTSGRGRKPIGLQREPAISYLPS